MCSSDLPAPQADTPEVAHAKAVHFAAHAEARARNAAADLADGVIISRKKRGIVSAYASPLYTAAVPLTYATSYSYRYDAPKIKTPAPVVKTYVTAPVVKTIAPAPVVRTYVAAPVVKTVAPAPIVKTYVAPAPIVKTYTYAPAPIRTYSYAPTYYSSYAPYTYSYGPAYGYTKFLG